MWVMISFVRGEAKGRLHIIACSCAQTKKAAHAAFFKLSVSRKLEHKLRCRPVHHARAGARYALEFGNYLAHFESEIHILAQEYSETAVHFRVPQNSGNADPTRSSYDISRSSWRVSSCFCKTCRL